MRSSLLIIVSSLILGLPISSTAQICPAAGITTDPTNPSNPGGTPNTFNWFYGNYQPATYSGRRYTLNSSAINQPYIELPWQQPSNVNMERFQGLNDIPANGWELIRRDLGYDDNGNPASTTNPSLIIYNKYMGVLRVFVAVGQLYGSYQRAEIALNFDPAGAKKSGTLNRQTALGVALEDTQTGNASFSSIATFLNGSTKWFVADFPMDYDPCICQYDSRLIVSVNLISSLNVNLQGSTTGSITTSNGTSSGSFNDGIPLIRNVNGVINGAGTSYDNVDKLTNKLIAETSNQNQKTAISTLQTALKSNSFLQQGLQALPYVGAAVGLLDFFIGGGQDSTPQPLALQPLAVDLTTTTTGTITSNNLYVTTPFLNPGNRSSSASTVIPEDRPFYNEAMGVFSLLQRPVVDYTTKTTITGNRANQVRTTLREYRLTQELAYVINPAANMQVVDFQVALVGAATSYSGASYTPGGNFSTIDATASRNSNGTFDNLYRTDYYDASCIKNNIFDWYSVYNAGSGNDIDLPNIYVKVMLNLKPLRGTGQNVLFVARYPITANLVSTLPQIPTSTCGVLAQASASTVQSVCNGSKYVAAISSFKKSTQTASVKPANTNGSISATGPALTIYPNPAVSDIQFTYITTQPGHVSIILRDALGREAVRVVETDAAVGTFNAIASVTQLPSGIYYCTLQTPTEKVVQRVMITQ